MWAGGAAFTVIRTHILAAGCRGVLSSVRRFVHIEIYTWCQHCERMEYIVYGVPLASAVVLPGGVPWRMVGRGDGEVGGGRRRRGRRGGGVGGGGVGGVLDPGRVYLYVRVWICRCMVGKKSVEVVGCCLSWTVLGDVCCGRGGAGCVRGGRGGAGVAGAWMVP